MEGLRICTFVILPCLYFGLRNDKKEYDNADAERQSLLRKKVAPKPSSSEDSTVSGNGYGSTSAQESDTAEEASEAESEDSWLAEQRKAQELIAKRLKQDGNWFTYAKGFAVSSYLCIRGNKDADPSVDILSIHLAVAQQDSAVQSCPCWPLSTCHERLERSSPQPNGRND